MKIALIITGLARRYEMAYPSTKKFFLDRHDVDIYLSTWTHSYDYPIGGALERPETIEEFHKVDTDHFLELYKPHKYHIEDTEKFLKNRFPSIKLDLPVFLRRGNSVSIERYRNQWYIVKKGFELISDPYKYDVIVRLRTDMIFTELTIQEPKDYTIIVDRDVPADNTYGDWFAYGDPVTMSKYCTMFDYIEDMYRRDRLDISSCGGVVKHYLNNKWGIMGKVDPNTKWDNVLPNKY